MAVSTAPTTENAARRRIGDILLELGFASEVELAEAAAEQEQTGQPLGQILVGRGVITRLELASALAEQWSDQSLSISLLPIPKPAAAAAPQHHNDDQYAARLQDAVADLARRVHATQPSEAADERVTDLAERIEATVARTQRIEATLATLADSLEGVTGGAEEAFASLQGGMASLALDLGRVDATVAEMVARPAVPAADPALSERLEELAAAVGVLADRPPVDDGTRGRVDEIAFRLESLADAAALDDLRGAVGGVQAQVQALADGNPAFAELERQAGLLNDLRATVVDLETRPVGSPEVDARLELIEARLAERFAAAPDAAAVAALAARIETAFDRQEGVDEALGARLDEIADLAGRGDGTTARVDELEHRLTAGAAVLDDLRRELADRPEPPSARKLEKLAHALDALKRDVASHGKPAPDDRVERLARRVEELTSDRVGHERLAGRLETLEGRLSSDVVTNDELSRALDRTREELGQTIPEPDGRVDQLAHDLETLRADLARAREELGQAIPEPDGRVDRLTHDLETLRADLARAREEVAGAIPEPDGRVDQLAHDFETLRHDLARAREELGQTIPEPDGRVDRLAHDLDAVRADLARVRDEVTTATPAPDTRIDRLTEELAIVRAEIARVDAPVTPDPELPGRLELLAHRVEELSAGRAEQAALAAELRAVEARLASDVVTSSAFEQTIGEIRDELARPAASPPASPETELAVARLEEHLGALEALSARVDDLAEAVVAASPVDPAVAADDMRREVEQRIAELRRTLGDRLAATGSAPSEGIAAPVGIDEELERMRMAMERVGLHLGEHDHALGELMRSRGVTQRLDELAARIDDLAGSGAATARPGHAATESTADVRALVRRVDDAEAAAAADREKLMTRFERIVSSIDWRLQRLEAGDTE